MYSPRKQNTFLFYNHITTYREQLVVVLEVREWGIYVRKSFSFLTPLLLAKEVFFFKMNLQPLTGPRSKQDRHKSTVPWQRHHHLGYPSLSSAFGHLLQVRTPKLHTILKRKIPKQKTHQLLLPASGTDTGCGFLGNALNAVQPYRAYTEREAPWKLLGKGNYPPLACLSLRGSKKMLGTSRFLLKWKRHR